MAGYPEALLSLRPGAEWTLVNTFDYSTLEWLSEGEPPTLDEVNAEVERLNNNG